MSEALFTEAEVSQPVLMNNVTIGPYKLLSGAITPEFIDPGERFRKDYEDGGELENSIREHGVLQSLLVLARQDQPYLLLAGGRRYNIARKLQLKTVPVLVATTELSELDIRTLELVENMHRRQLTPAEDLAIKKEIHRLQVEKHGKAFTGGGLASQGWRIEDTAKMLGVSKATISQDLKLATALEKLPELQCLKDKKTMNKVLEQLHTTILRDEKAKAFEKDMQEGPKKKLCDSYIIMDFFQAVKNIPDASINLVEADPPFGIPLKELRKDDGFLSQYSEADYNDNIPDYPKFLEALFTEAYRVLASNGWFIFWHGSGFEWFQQIIEAANKAGFNCYPPYKQGIWLKPTGYGCQANNLAKILPWSWEPFLYLQKSPLSTICNPGHLNHFSYSPVFASQKIHPTERPVEMIQDILQTFVEPNSRILVPFAGSGNTLLACANAQMHGVGFDLAPAYKAGFTIRVNEGEFGHYRSLK